MLSCADHCATYSHVQAARAPTQIPGQLPLYPLLPYLFAPREYIANNVTTLVQSQMTSLANDDLRAMDIDASVHGTDTSDSAVTADAAAAAAAAAAATAAAAAAAATERRESDGRHR